ncbi:DNA-processing protein DprA [Jannaschia seosinensis]|nr:DNA-processing protein DprA [Jannaschia seosinensis]
MPEPCFDLLAVPEGAVGFAEGPLPFFDASPSEEETFARLRLIRSRRVGSATWRRMLAQHGSAVAALEALPDVAARAGDAGYRPAEPAQIRRELAAGHKRGARLLTLGAPGYPERLRHVSDPPCVLWAEGRVELLNAHAAVALVGTRNASSLALRMARALGRDLSEGGVTVVSGLARGVDTAAHEAALAGQGGTVAVHAGGLDRVYPRENADLAARIAAEGCALSERPYGLEPQARDFPRRNRIVAGLAQGVVVVEAAARSGSMITARDAADAGREVMAVPGHPFDGRTGGCNLLLRDGATLVRGVEDVMEAIATAEMPEPAHPARPPAARQAVVAPEPDHVRRCILDHLSHAPVEEDDLIRDVLGTGGIPKDLLAAQLSEMELTGLVLRAPGGGLMRV